MSEFSNETLTELLSDMKMQIESGFKGVHTRQDKTNGNVIRNREDIDKLKIWKATLVGAWTVISVLLGFVANRVF